MLLLNHINNGVRVTFISDQSLLETGRFHWSVKTHKNVLVNKMNYLLNAFRLDKKFCLSLQSFFFICAPTNKTNLILDVHMKVLNEAKILVKK